MTVELVYKDGTTEIVDRCVRVHAKTKKGWTLRWCAQRQPKGPLIWLDSMQLAKVNFAAELPESWRPNPVPA